MHLTMSNLKEIIIDCVSTLSMPNMLGDYTENDGFDLILSNLGSNSEYYKLKSNDDMYEFFKKKPFYTRRLICAIALANERQKNPNIKFDLRWKRKRELMLVFKKGMYTENDFSCQEGGCLKKMIGKGTLSDDNVPRIIFGYL